MSRPKDSKKPSKPHPDFPLYPHRNGQWAKTIRGRKYYFGPWNDPEGAMRAYRAQLDQILLGADPGTLRDPSHEPDLRYLCNYFLSGKELEYERGDISKRMFHEYLNACKRIVEHMGGQTPATALTPARFGAYRQTFPDTWGVYRIRREVRQVETMLRYCAEEQVIPSIPVTGKQFKAPTLRSQRQHRQQQEAEHGKKLFTPEQVRMMVEQSDVRWKAMILTGINAAFGNTDIATVPVSVFDFKAGFVSFGRQKTGVARTAALWPETIEAVQESLSTRAIPKNPEDDRLVFLTQQGRRYVRVNNQGEPINALSQAFRKKLQRWGIYRKGLGFYCLRRTFRTIAYGAKDPETVNHVMGHADESMGALYTQEIDKQCLRDVAEFVRAAIFTVFLFAILFCDLFPHNNRSGYRWTRQLQKSRRNYGSVGGLCRP